MPVVGAQIYCHSCSSEALEKGNFPLHHLEGTMRLVVVSGGAHLSCPPVFHAPL